MMLTKLDDAWEVEVLGLSERGAIDTLSFHSASNDEHYPRVRFDRGKMMFLDAAPALSSAARQELAGMLVRARSTGRRSAASSR
jgi:hypothetical protein